MTRMSATSLLAGATLVATALATGLSAQAASDSSQLVAGTATSSGQSYTSSELGSAEADRGTVRDNEQMVVHPGIVVAVPGTAKVGGALPPALVDQLAADAGVSPAKADDMTLNQLSKMKFSRDNSL